MNMRVIAMGTSLAVAVLMLIGKLTAYFITGSTAILSDAAESVIHIAASGVAAFSLWYSMQAPDRKHPYGHGKIVYFSAGFEGALIGVAALSIAYLAIRALIAGVELTELHIGLLITGFLAAINGLLGLFLIRVGKRNNSLVLVANGQHVLTDMWSSAGVLAGVGIVWLTGITWLDPVAALLVAANILYASYALIRNAFQGLLDQADPVATQRILSCLQKMVEE
jgi:cation diffusion facilitator family transporter